MKKTLIVILFTALVSISIVFMTPKKAEAETTQDITPFYGGDILSGKDLYLFEQYTTNPNFENGYISKKTISSQDVYYSNSVATHFNGWYKDLGMGLIDSYVEQFPSVNQFVFYIPFDNMLSRYFQLALWVGSTYNAYHYIKYVDENPIRILSVEDVSRYLLMVDDGNKQIEWYAYEVMYPDYLPSFRPLTAQLAYEFGFDSGKTEGFTEGYTPGYNFGYHEGYNQGLTDGAITGYTMATTFNQLIRNGNFTNTDYWLKTSQMATFTTENETATIKAESQNARLYQPVNIVSGHKYYFRIKVKSESATNLIRCGLVIDGGISWVGAKFVNATTEWQTLDSIFNVELTTDQENRITIRDERTSGWDNIQLKDAILIDLTLMYGEGNEPQTIEQCKQIFSSSYYDYTESQVISLNYLDGYNEGINKGYQKGKNAQATEQLTATGWIQNIFSGMGSLLALQIFPGVTIGLIVGIPFVISLAYFVIRAFRGGGGA